MNEKQGKQIKEYIEKGFTPSTPPKVNEGKPQIGIVPSAPPPQPVAPVPKKDK